jgi:asparagine synthase (glutamine-hydrolysing)
VLLRPQQCLLCNFERLSRTARIHYREDREYEEHLRIVFAESVRRRLRSDSPVLAELSGGMDSSSIVCVADQLIAEQKTHVPRLDTVSFYDASEPNWDERPYFTTIEKRRGRVGCHIDVSRANQSVPGLDGIVSGSIPSDVGLDPSEAPFRQCLTSNGNRIVLSGIGGDEVMGGVPSPSPELSDLLVKARLGSLLSRGIEWALATRQPLINLFASTCRSFLPRTRHSLIESCPAVEWLRPEFIRRQIPALRGYDERFRVFGQLPSYQENLSALGSLQRQLECCGRRTSFPHEVRYPYLDKDLLHFLFAIPREQMVRPGRRRSLMRRALVGIVPQEILERKRKAYILRGPMTAIAQNWTALDAFTTHMVSEEMGIFDAGKFRKALLRIREGIAVPISPVFRTLLVEQWLRGQVQRSAENTAHYDAATPSITHVSFRGQAAPASFS